jgi:hypothetical protein
MQMIARYKVVCPVLMAAGAARAQISRDVGILAAEELGGSDRTSRTLKKAPASSPTDRRQLAIGAAK